MSRLRQAWRDFATSPCSSAETIAVMSAWVAIVIFVLPRLAP